MKKVKIDKPISELSPLDVTCTTTQCEVGFHCFKSSKRSITKHNQAGVCKDCGADLVDWGRVHKNDLSDVNYTFECLKKELLRHVIWCNSIENDALKFASQRGRKAIRIKAKQIITQNVRKPADAFDGRRTPKSGKEIIHYAQHATATCCRKCLEYWHNIPQDTTLTTEQIDFCVELVSMYVDEKVTDLAE